MSASPSAPIVDRLQRIRDAMRLERVDALLVPSADPHLSEYLPAFWQGRQWLSGFHGSVGTLVITADFAGVWADSRYWEQATAELSGTTIELMKILPGQPGPLEWLADNAGQGDCVAVDGAVMALASARSLGEKLAARGATLRTDLDVLAMVWTERPALPANPVYEHLPPYASQSRSEKLAQLRREIAERGADWHFLATLDDIAWLLNLRGSDVSYNPVFLGFALVGQHSAQLFVSSGRLEPGVLASLQRDGVEVVDYQEVTAALAALPAESALLIDPAKVTSGRLASLPHTVRLVEGMNPTTLSKSRKTATDAANVRAVMERDGAALCEFFEWLESALGKQRVTELTVDTELTAARQRQQDFVSPSFATIAAFNANGAMPHYRATEQSHALIEGDGLLLIDSGGQYLGGTTDITRMVPIGSPTIEQKADCTRVLKGMIALSRARFPHGILSPLLDAIARAPLWADSVDYGHGTGHGVGYFMNVHEGPQVIAFQAAAAPHTAMLPGMITSIEPGTYRPGRWGVRIENLVLTQVAQESEFGRFLAFETLTLCPIDTRCFVLEMLDASEKDWLNSYHTHVRERLAPLLNGAALAWLRARTEPV